MQRCFLWSLTRLFDPGVPPGAGLRADDVRRHPLTGAPFKPCRIFRGATVPKTTVMRGAR